MVPLIIVPGAYHCKRDQCEKGNQMNSLLGKLVVLPVAIFIIFHFSASTFAGDLDKPYSPTRKEWLEISIFKVIKDRTDSWRTRIGFIVWVVEKENTAFVTLTSANWEEPLPKAAEDQYVQIVKSDIEAFLKNYDWSKGLRVFVH